MHLDVVMAWNATLPTLETLSIWASLYRETPPDEQPFIEGRSPLHLQVDVNGSLVDEPYLALGPSTNPGQPVAVNATVIEQPVTLTITKTYRCLEG